MHYPNENCCENTHLVPAHSSRAAAVLTTCTKRKSAFPISNATAVSLPVGRQSEIETAWQARLRELPLACKAASLYAGRAIKLGRQAATISEAALYIISAGLGLVAGDQMVPAYGLTVSGLGTESIATRATGRFDHAAWWRSASAGPFSTELGSLFVNDSKLPVLVALTQQYAELIAESLEALGDAELRRLRIVGIGLNRFLSERVSRQVLPYDERLERVLPGTKVDFAQRALLHFAERGLRARPGADAADHSEWVASTLMGLAASTRPIRTRLSDSEIATLIEHHLPENPGVGRLLRILRDREGAACEQGRFARIYRELVERRSA